MLVKYKDIYHEKITKNQARTIALNQLLAVSLPQPEELMKKYPFMLSGGMCQRVMIAIASVFHPPLLIADEPTTALDVTIQAQILHQLDSMRKKDGTAILLITHDLGVVAEIADDVCIMLYTVNDLMLLIFQFDCVNPVISLFFFSPDFTFRSPSLVFFIKFR